MTDLRNPPFRRSRQRACQPGFHCGARRVRRHQATPILQIPPPAARPDVGDAASGGRVMTLLKSALLATAMLCASLVPVQAQTADPYAAGKADLARQQVTHMLDTTRLIYSAVGCKVVPDATAGAVTDRMAFSLFVSSDMQIRLLRLDLSNLQKQVRHARREGLTTAGISAEFNAGAGFEKARPMGTNCAAWQEHPEAVAAVRQLIKRF